MSTLNFNVAYGITYEDAQTSEVNSTIYAEDLNLCQSCIDIVGDCFPCLTTSQKVFSDLELTIIVPDGYYRHPYSEEITTPTWHIVSGYPQPAGFTG